MQRPVWNQLATFVVWLLAAGSIVFWAMKFVRGPQAPAASTSVSSAQSASGGVVDPLALARGLGGGLAPPSSTAAPAAAPSPLQASRFVLTGVVVDRSRASRGVALIAVDGKPPRPYRVGSQLADGVFLRSVSPGKALLAPSLDASSASSDLSLELPVLNTASAGTAIAGAAVQRPALAPPSIFPSNPSAPPAAPASSQLLSPTLAAPPANAPATLGAAAGNRPPRGLANPQRAAEKEARNPAAGEAAPAP